MHRRKFSQNTMRNLEIAQGDTYAILITLSHYASTRAGLDKCQVMMMPKKFIVAPIIFSSVSQQTPIEVQSLFIVLYQNTFCCVTKQHMLIFIIAFYMLRCVPF